MATGYVVVQVGYDYNDEIYCRSESGGGTPTKIYLDYNKAKAELHRLNLLELVTCEIGHYAYDLEDIINDMEEFIAIINKYDLKSEVNLDDSYKLGEWFSSNAGKFSQEDQEKILNLVSLSFYELAEVEFDDSVIAPKAINTTCVDSSRFKV